MALIVPRTRAIIETIIILIGGSRHVSLYKIPDRDFVLRTRLWRGAPPIGSLSASARAELGVAPFGLEGLEADGAEVPHLRSVTLPALALFAAVGASRLAPMFVEHHGALNRR
jgi:hypothetical protein